MNQIESEKAWSTVSGAGTSPSVPDDILGSCEELRWMEPHMSSPPPCNSPNMADNSEKDISGIAFFFMLAHVNYLQVLCSSLRLHQDHFRQCIQPHTLLDRMSKDVPDRMSRDMPERMSEDVPDKMSEDMLERLPDIMSEDLPDRIPSPRNLQPFKNECSPLFLPALLFIGPTSLASEGQSKAMRAMPQKGHHAQQAGGTSGLQG